MTARTEARQRAMTCASYLTIMDRQTRGRLTAPHDSRNASMPRRLEIALSLAVLVGLFLSLFLGGAQMGLAYDELFHIPAGYTFVDTGVRRSTT